MKYVLFALGVLFLVACGDEEPAETPAAEATTNTTIPTETVTLTPPPTASSTLTLEPTATDTPTPLPTSTPVPTDTPTPSPTATAITTPAPTSVPQGYHRKEDAGFAFVLPSDWKIAFEDEELVVLHPESELVSMSIGSRSKSEEMTLDSLVDEYRVNLGWPPGFDVQAKDMPTIGREILSERAIVSEPNPELADDLIRFYYIPDEDRHYYVILAGPAAFWFFVSESADSILNSLEFFVPDTE